MFCCTCRSASASRCSWSGGWDVRTRPSGNAQALADLDTGSTSLWVDAASDLSALLDGVLLDLAPVVLEGTTPDRARAYADAFELPPVQPSTEWFSRVDAAAGRLEAKQYAQALADALELTDGLVTFIRDALPSICQGAEVEAGDWSGLAAAIDGDGQVDYTGASGAVCFDDETGDVLSPYYIGVWTVTDGTIVDERVECVGC
jgi:hypothetical protein